jgi:RNA polymerase subunit RPABC4/transcription elongation factor Spt4
MQQTIDYTILNASKTRAITSSTDATPIVITAAANHGLATGDRVTIMGHTTNVAANGTWTITKVADATFSLDGSVGSGAGAGADGTYTAQAPKSIFCQDFETIQFSLATDGGGDYAAVLKVATSNQETCPDFAAPQTVTNHYDYVNIIDLEDNASIDGNTGITTSGADDYRHFELNTNYCRWFTVIPTEGTEGEITVKATLTTRSI